MTQEVSTLTAEQGNRLHACGIDHMRLQQELVAEMRLTNELRRQLQAADRREEKIILLCRELGDLTKTAHHLLGLAREPLVVPAATTSPPLAEPTPGDDGDETFDRDVFGSHPVPEERLDRLTQVELDRLPEYSLSNPSGVVLGKRWKRRYRGRWITGVYVPADEPGKAIVYWRKVVPVSPSEGSPHVTDDAPVRQSVP
jgi:hypothetical protein